MGALVCLSDRTHESYHPVTETLTNIISIIKSLMLCINDENYSVLELHDKKKNSCLIAIANADADTSKKHLLNINNKSLDWEGLYIIKNKNQKYE